MLGWRGSGTSGSPFGGCSEWRQVTVVIDEVTGLLLSFFGSDKREVGSDEDLSEASEGSGHGSGSGIIPEGSGGC